MIARRLPQAEAWLEPVYNRMGNSGRKAALAALGSMVFAAPALSSGPGRPNIVVIITDQQQQGKLSYYGDTGLNTPWMDSIARDGYSFTNARCAFPLSMPQRLCMFTGLYPSTFNLRVNPDNGNRDVVEWDKLEQWGPNTLGQLFKSAGYDTFYGGKSHLPWRDDNNSPEKYGFTDFYADEDNRRNLLGPDAAEFLLTKQDNGKPFLMVVSYINPHDICEFDDFVDLPHMDPKRRKVKIPGLSRVSHYIYETYRYPDREAFFNEICPQLPDNYELTDHAPDGMPGHLSPYTKEQWQLHRWVYNRLIEEADTDIAPVLLALDKGGYRDNTIVIFLSDHGDMDGAHRREHKSVPYEEAQRVPFIFSGPGIPKGVIDTRTSVNAGVDLLPTLCDFASIPVPEGCEGKSLKDIITGKSPSINRKYVFCEGANWFQVIEDGRYKLTLLEVMDNALMLVDLKEDMGEMYNLAGKQEYAEIKDRLLKVLFDDLKRRGIEPRTDNYGKAHY